MKKIIGLGIVALLVIGLVGGGTWAYFSDYEQSTDNNLVAGTLDLGLASNASADNATGGTSGTWNWDLEDGWAPGDNQSGYLAVKNQGTIAMNTVKVSFAYEFTEGTPDSVHPIGTDDTDNLTKMIKVAAASWGGTSAGALEGKSLDELVTASPITLTGGLDEVDGTDDEKDLEITWNLDPTATNGCQGDSVDLTVTVYGYQQ